MNNRRKTWDDVHRERQWGIWPGEHVVRFVMRRYGDIPLGDRDQINFLDIGCGTGANAWFLAQEGFSVYGIDASPTAIERATQRFGGMIRRGACLKIQLEMMDAKRLRFPPNQFDCVIDSCCLQHFFYPRDTELAIAEIHRVLRPGGRVFSKMASERHSERGFGGMEASRMSLAQVKTAFGAFHALQINHSEFSDPRHGAVAHYLVEGVKSPQ